MATAAAPKIDTAKAEAAAEKAYAAAAEQTKAATAPVAEAVAKAAPAAKPAPAAKQAPVKKAAAKAAKKPAAKKAPARKQVPAKTLTKAPARKAALKTKPAARAVKAAAAPIATKLKDTIMAKTQTTADAFTARVKDTVAEAQTRAKTAYEKSTAFTSELTELNKGHVEALVESGKILAAGLQDMGKDAVAQGKTALETLTADVKEIAAVKSPTDFFKLQGEIMRRNFDAAVATGSKRSEAMVKLAGDAFAPLSSRFSVAVEKIKQAA